MRFTPKQIETIITITAFYGGNFPGHLNMDHFRDAMGDELGDLLPGDIVREILDLTRQGQGAEAAALFIREYIHHNTPPKYQAEEMTIISRLDSITTEEG